MLAEPTKRYEIDKDYTSSWFALTPNRLLATLGPLREEINCDVCVIGGGFTGLSAALELSKKGYSVTLLEAKAIVDSACGKNGGHVIRGFTRSLSTLTRKFDPTTAKTMCNMTLQGLALVIERIAKHDIKCDLKFGHVTAAANGTQVSALRHGVNDWANIGHKDLKYLDKPALGAYIKTKKYVAGVYDPKGAHFHPLNYALGMAQAAQALGCKIYDETPVVSIDQTSPARVVTKDGAVNAKYLVLGGHIKVEGVEQLGKRINTVSAFMIATEPLGEKNVAKMLPLNSAITDASFEMNYFKLSSDNRLLFGGNCTSSGPGINGQDAVLKKRMLEVFPDLADVKLEHCWTGPMDITLNRLPDFGRLAPNIFYAHGYCGHNIVLGNLAGQLIAEAMSGTAERFDVFAKIRHTSFIGGKALRQPLFALGTAWNRIQDLLF